MGLYEKNVQSYSYLKKYILKQDFSQILKIQNWQCIDMGMRKEVFLYTNGIIEIAIGGQFCSIKI